MCRRVILGVILLGFSCSFGFQDSDLDGVEDSVDKCPNTPFFCNSGSVRMSRKRNPDKEEKGKVLLKNRF